MQAWKRNNMKRILLTTTLSILVFASGCGTNLLTGKKTFKLKSAVVRGSGDVVPVTQTDFTFRKYNKTALVNEIVSKNNPGIKPNSTDAKYVNEDCLKKTGAEMSSCLDDSFKAYKADLTEWESKQNTGVQEAIDKMETTTPSTKVTTDLSGLATVELPEGVYYVSGEYSNSVSNITWDNVEVTVDSKLETLEMSNSNGIVK